MRHTPRYWMAMVALCTIGLSSNPPLAAEERRQCPICANAGRPEATYAEKAGSTFARGAANTLLGWTDLIRQPAREVKESGNLATGLVEGVGSSILRTLGGVGELLTFWTPKVNHQYIHFAKDCPVCAANAKKAAAPESSTSH